MNIKTPLEGRIVFLGGRKTPEDHRKTYNNLHVFDVCCYYCYDY